MQYAVVSFILTFIFSVRSHEECHLMALYENYSDFVVFMVNFSSTVSVTRRAVFHTFLHLCAHKAWTVVFFSAKKWLLLDYYPDFP